MSLLRWPGSAGKSAADGPPRRPPHLFLFCIDALRADCLDDSGADSIWNEIGRPSTPALDAFASAARVHCNAVASSAWTKPSVPSMFLSRHPSEHGVFEVAKSKSNGGTAAALPEDAATIAERLREAGYRTIGLAHNAQLDSSLGFTRGFDSWSSNAGNGEAILESLRGLRPFEDEKPVFVYFHFLEPHFPYGRRIVQRAKAFAAGRFPFHTMRGADWRTLKRDLQDGRAQLEPEETAFLRRVYQLAVEEADRVVGLVLDWLTQQGALDRSLAIVVSDHGEELLDHGAVGHGQSLHGELTRIPFLVRAGRASGVNVTQGTTPELTGHVDLLPTLLGAAGLEARGVSGRNLLRDPEPQFVFSEVKHKRRYRQSLRDRKWKLIRNRYFRRAENGSEDYNNLEELFAGRESRVELLLYDVSNDPRETVDLAAERPDVTARLEKELDLWWGARRVLDRNERAMEEELIRRLEALGYL